LLILHRKADSLAFQVHAQHFDHHLLLEGNHLCGVLNELAGSQLRDVYQTFYMYAYIHERAKIGYVADYSGQYHIGLDILDGVHLV
jgi:hypothetical protein